MDSFTPLSPVQQTAAPAPVAAIDIRPLPPVSVPVAPTGALPANDEVIELSGAARLLSAASAAQDINPAQGKDGNFANVLSAALNLVSAFNSLSGNPDTAGNPIASAANTPGILDITSGTASNLLLQAFSNTALDSAVVGGNSDGASLLTGLANIGVTVQGPLSANATATLTVNPQLLLDAFNGNPAGTSATLAQASLVFAPLAAGLIAQNNALFLTAQDVAAATNSLDTLPAQPDLAAGNPAIPTVPTVPAAVAEANAALQRTLADEALSEAIALTEAGSLPAPIVTANPGGAGAAASPAPAGIAAASNNAVAEGASNNTGAGLVVQDTSAGSPAANPGDTNNGAVDIAAANQGLAGNATIQNTANVATTTTTVNTTANLPNTAANTAANGLAEAANADTAAGALPEAANTSTNQADNAAPANAVPVSGPAPAIISAAGTADQASLDIQPVVALNLAGTDTLAASAAAPATAAASSATPAATGNPNTISPTDPAFAAAIAAYNLRVPFTTVMDDRGAREVASQIIEAVNSVESVSAISPVKLNVHDEVAAAQRNAMLRNDTASKT
ncbi:MAG: hypothetical protein V4488_15535 [Pseudomonadota bacterium]